MTTPDEPVSRREVDLALRHEEEREDAHRAAHDAEHVAHSEKHLSESRSIATALDAVNRERTIHATAHDREHENHQRQHGFGQLAIDKAEQASDKRFDAVNGTRNQMNDLIGKLASKDTVEGMAADFARRWEENRKELDRRFGELHTSVVNIEKGDVKGEGKELGRNAMVAIIVTALTIVGGIVSLIVVVSNLATG